MKYLVAFWLLVLSCGLSRAAELNSGSTRWLAIGNTTEIQLQGSDLAVENEEDPQLWTSFPATVELVQGEARDRNRATFRITPAAQAKPGIAAIRAYNSQGVSHPLFVWIDRTPVTTGEQRFDQASAQELKLPATVAGTTADRRQLFFRFTADAGQTLSVEVAAQRIGIDVDPVIALLDAKGRELIFADDDPLLGADCRFSLRIPAAGTYYLALNDLEFRGGRPFLLRVGHFPLPVNVFPLGISPQTATTFDAIDLGADQPRTFSATASETLLDGVRQVTVDQHAFSQARVFVSSLRQYVESEPNDRQEAANAIAIPAAVSGRFLARGDIDAYKFSAKQGQWLTISPMTRSLNSPACVRVKLIAERGGVIVDSRESGLDETSQRTRIPQDGDYCLVVSDLLRGHGPSYGYHLLLETNRGPFTLTAPYDKKIPRHRPVVVPGGVLLVPIKVQRHGYDGPIRLTASAGNKELEVAGELLPERQNDAALRIHIPRDFKPISLAEIVVSGHAEIEGASYSATLDVRPLIHQDFPQLSSLPLAAGSAITAAVIPPTFSGKAESATVVRGAKAEILVSIEWQGLRREAVSLVPFNLPPDCRLENIEKTLDANTVSSKLTLVTTDKTPAGTYDKVFLEAIGRIHGEEFRLELPLTLTITEKEDDHAK